VATAIEVQDEGNKELTVCCGYTDRTVLSFLGNRLTRTQTHACARTLTHTHTRAHTHSNTHARTHAHIHTHTQSHTLARARTHTHAHTSAHIHARARLHIHTHTRARIHTHSFVHVLHTKILTCKGLIRYICSSFVKTQFLFYIVLQGNIF
jgi:hypothetical protein